MNFRYYRFTNLIQSNNKVQMLQILAYAVLADNYGDDVCYNFYIFLILTIVFLLTNPIRCN